MKHIRKGGTPHELKNWLSNQPVIDGRCINCDYESMRRVPDVRDAVEKALLEEQGYLCCYTGASLHKGDYHVEHFKPQSQCDKEKFEDVEFSNLFAAYPRSANCPFGAKKKDNWYHEDLLINPLDEKCEHKFGYDLLGQIAVRDENDEAAKETITRLALDHELLTDMRYQVIEKTLYRNNEPLPDRQLQVIIERYCERNTHSGHFHSFCFVIQQAAQSLLEKQQKKRQKQRYMKKKKRK